MLASLFYEPLVEGGVNLPQLGDRHLDTALLLLEQFDLLHALLAGEVQAAVVLPVEKMFDLRKREAQPSAGQYETETFAVTRPIQPRVAMPVRRDEAFGLVKAQGAERETVLLRDLADCQRPVAVCVAGRTSLFRPMRIALRTRGVQVRQARSGI